MYSFIRGRELTLTGCCCIILAEGLVLGRVWVQIDEVRQVLDAVSQASYGKVFGCVRGKVPDLTRVFTCGHRDVIRTDYH